MHYLVFYFAEFLFAILIFFVVHCEQYVLFMGLCLIRLWRQNIVFRSWSQFPPGDSKSVSCLIVSYCHAILSCGVV